MQSSSSSLFVAFKRPSLVKQRPIIIEDDLEIQDMNNLEVERPMKKFSIASDTLSLYLDLSHLRKDSSVFDATSNHRGPRPRSRSLFKPCIDYDLSRVFTNAFVASKERIGKAMRKVTKVKAASGNLTFLFHTEQERLSQPRGLGETTSSRGRFSRDSFSIIDGNVGFESLFVHF